MKIFSLLIILVVASFVQADQPETIAGTMVVDEVLLALRQNAVEKHPLKRLERLRKVAKTRDARVAIALVELIEGKNIEISFGALRLIVENFTEGVWDEKKDELANERRFAACYRNWYLREYEEIQIRAKELPN
jgi:hypothetical protein